MDLDAVEIAPLDFYRKDSWRPGMYALSTKPISLEDEDLGRLSSALATALFQQLEFFESAVSVRRFLADGRGRLQLLMTFEPKQGAIVVPAEFVKGWGQLGGSLSLDIPLNP